MVGLQCEKSLFLKAFFAKNGCHDQRNACMVKLYSILSFPFLRNLECFALWLETKHQWIVKRYRTVLMHCWC